MTFLLDVNVLIALFDTLHVHHGQAHRWFARSGCHGWATCPSTENGFVRIVGATKYVSVDAKPLDVIGHLAEMCQTPNHVFWPDSISLRDAPTGANEIVASKQVTDAYLALLAMHHGGKLATLDQRIAYEHAALASAIETLPVD